MKLLVLTDALCDFTDVLCACGADVETMTVPEAAKKDISDYDAYCLLGKGQNIDARVHIQLEQAAEAGKHVFIQATGSFHGIYSAGAVDTTRKRLIYVDPEDGTGIEGLTTGDLLDDHSNLMRRPWNLVAGYKPLLVYKEHILAHAHLNATKEEILSGGDCGLWMLGDSIMMTSFCLHNFNRARFSPRRAWEKLIRYIAKWITGAEPASLPAPVLSHGTDADLSDPAVFDRCREEAIHRGMDWLMQFLVDQGLGGIREGLRHCIDPEGVQSPASTIRNDCCGEAAGAFKLYARLYGDEDARRIAENIDSFTYGPMMIHGGPYDGFMRWTEDAWQVCYQDDVARCVLSGLYDCVFLGRDETFPSICRALDFLVNSTAKDGCRVARSDLYATSPEGLAALAEAETGNRSAHYNAYYHAALLLAYKHGGNPRYLETARSGLETLMSIYPNTGREQSETEEMCRLVLPLAILYDVTREASHRDMLYRVVGDLVTHKHPSGGYYEWDTGYKASCSRESTGECSLLTENGDPVADLLYSTNWLPIGFAYAYYATGDDWFKSLWRDVVAFCIRSQVISEDPLLDGSWCRAFDMDMWEAYACPHDVGWAACCSESGWTDAEILMGMMLMDLME